MGWDGILAIAAPAPRLHACTLIKHGETAEQRGAPKGPSFYNVQTPRAGYPATVSLLRRFIPILGFVAICWLVFGLNALVWHGDLNRYGIVPRHVGGLPAILWSPFLHASVEHLVANTVPLLVLGILLCGRNAGEFVEVAVVGIVGGGLLTWLIARPASHIGASGLVFCFFAYLVSLAFFNRTLGSLLLALVCLVVYGGILRGVLPTSTAVSWEGHLAGLAAGVVVAWLRAGGRAKSKRK